MKSAFTTVLKRNAYKITKPIRLIELFAGYGSQALALKRIGADYENWFVCEFDNFVMQSYNAVHGTNFPTTDIRNVCAENLNIVDTDKYEYLLTYSYPCQSISVAGKQKGMAKGSGTRSSLLWEVERLLTECGNNLPNVLLMENVPNVLSESNIGAFTEWLNFLKSKGYSNYYQIMNAKDFNIPQNRERCFMISILGTGSYVFPDGVKPTKHFVDVLEKDVAENFYLNNENTKKLLDNLIKQDSIPTEITDKLTRLGNIYGDDKGTGFAGNVWDKMGVSPTLTTMGGGNRQPMILDCVPCRMVGRNPDAPKSRKKGLPTEQRIELKREDCSNTITTVQKDSMVLDLNNIGIRKLTPRECYRLMGVDDSDIDKMLAVVSNSQAYKQAGNSIVVDVLAAIFKQLL